MRRFEFRTILYYLCLEAGLAMAYDSWLGTTYLSGLAGQMGVDLSVVAVLNALPFIGSIGQLGGLKLMARFTSVRRYTLALACFARAIWLIPFICGAIWGFQAFKTNTPFPATLWFKVVTIVALVAGLAASLSGTGWNSWMRALIPSHFQPKFFGLRHRYIMGTLIGANLIAFVLISKTWHGLHLGFFILGIFALSSAALSTFLLSRVPNALSKKDSPPSTTRTMRWYEPLQDQTFRRVLIFGASFHGAVNLCSSYFSYFFTKELHIPLSTIAFWTCLTNLGNFLAAAYWARHAGRAASLPKILRNSGIYVAAAPLFYALPTAALFVIAPLEYFVNGLAWSGYTIAMTTLLFRSCPPKQCASYFALYAATCGLSGAMGTLLGGKIAFWLAPWGGFRALWILGSTARFGILYFFLPADAFAKANARPLIARLARTLRVRPQPPSQSV